MAGARVATHPPANSMEQRVWRKGLAVGCELREVASRRADGSRHVIVSALVASCNSERHVLMVCLKPRDRKKWAMFRRIVTDSKGNRNVSRAPDIAHSCMGLALRRRAEVHIVYMYISLWKEDSNGSDRGGHGKSPYRPIA